MNDHNVIHDGRKELVIHYYKIFALNMKQYSVIWRHILFANNCKYITNSWETTKYFKRSIINTLREKIELNHIKCLIKIWKERKRSGERRKSKEINNEYKNNNFDQKKAGIVILIS